MWPTTFFDKLSDLLSLAEDSDKNYTVAVLGDFNAKHALWDLNSTPNIAGTRLYNMLTDFGMSQLVLDGTRYAPDLSSCSVLEPLATPRPKLATLTDVSEPVSDHCCVHAEFRISSLAFRKGTTQEFVYPDLDKTDWPGLRAALANAPLFNTI